MSKFLVIVESPAKAKTIQKYLGSDYIIRATNGHICDLAKSVGGDLGIDIKNGIRPKYVITPDKKDKIKAIIDAAKTVDQIYVASDPDREGECIAFHVADQLKKIDKPMTRVSFNQITKPAILKAIETPVGFDTALYDAAQARRVIDRIVGFMVSPYLSTKLHDKLSAGRVQSVALRMIVERDQEVKDFIPEVFYNINVNLESDKKEFSAKLPRRVEDDAEAKQIKQDLEVASYKVTDIQTTQTLRNPSPAFKTSKLQQEAYTKLKFKPEKTMKLAQELYESGHITYLRTDSVSNAPEAIDAVRNYLTSNKFTVPKSPNTYKNSDAAQDAHEAIRPTHLEEHPDSIPLTGEQQQLYELIWRQFVASQMEPAVFDVVKVTIETDNGHILMAEGKIQKKEGWLAMMKTYLKKEKDVILPNLSVKSSISLLKSGVKLEKSQTKPPPKYNEGSLVAELERKSIGRPATYSNIISKISSRQYVKQTAAGFEVTELGRTVVDNLKDDFSFMDYLYTANMEKKLDEMAHGKTDYLTMMTEFFEAFKIEFKRATNAQGMDAGIKCPKCGNNTVVRKSKYGFFAGCVNYKAGCDGIVSISVEEGKVVEKTQQSKISEDVFCPDCGAGMIARPDGRFGPFYSCSNYPRCLGKRKMPYGKKCPDCGNELYATIFNEELKLACMGYPNCKHIEKLPSDANVNWTDPKSITPPTYAAKIEKVLKKKVEIK